MRLAETSTIVNIARIAYEEPKIFEGESDENTESENEKPAENAPAALSSETEKEAYQNENA